MPSTETMLEGGLDPLDQVDRDFQLRPGRVHALSQPEAETEV